MVLVYWGVRCGLLVVVVVLSSWPFGVVPRARLSPWLPMMVVPLLRRVGVVDWGVAPSGRPW